jgi:SAM-dependent methyltransferase
MNTTILTPMSIQEPKTNDNAVKAWNTVLFDKFCRFKPLLTTGLGIHGRAALERHPPSRGSRVIDLGCGFGDMTIPLARSVGVAGEAVGVEVAERFVAAAREDAAAADVTNARFFVGDIETADLQRNPVALILNGHPATSTPRRTSLPHLPAGRLARQGGPKRGSLQGGRAVGGPFGHAFSRFGTMFCASPVQALRNVRRALVLVARSAWWCGGNGRTTHGST